MLQNIKLSLRYLKKNKGRTLLTLFGIIISISMVTSIGNILLGFNNLLTENISREYGSQEFIVKGLDQEELTDLQANREVKSLSKKVYDGTLISDKSEKDKNRLYYYDVYALDENYMKDLFTFKLVEGRMPEKANEIIVPIGGKNLIDGLDKIGNSISLEKVKLVYNSSQGPDRESTDIFTGRHFGPLESYEKTDKEKVEYTVVGFYNNGVYNNHYSLDDEGSDFVKERMSTIFTYADSDMESDYSYVKLNSSQDIRGTIEHIAKNFNLEEDKDYFLNSEYINLLNISKNEFYGGFISFVIGFLISIIIAAIVLFIYNVFTTNYNERIRDYGLLKVVGMTNRQLKSIIFFESVFYILIAIPLGYLAGNIAMKIVFAYTGSILEASAGIESWVWLKSSFDWRIFAISLVLGSAIVFLSSFLAARKVLTLSPIRTLSADINDKSEKIKNKKYRFVRGIFGYEGFLARRNIDRNKKRYVMSALSIGMSIVLFVTVTFFTGLFDNEFIQGKEIKESFVGTIQVNSEEGKDLLAGLEGLDGINYVDYHHRSALNLLPKGKSIESDKIEEIIKDKYDNSDTTNGLIVIPDKKFESYGGKMDGDKLSLLYYSVFDEVEFNQFDEDEFIFSRVKVDDYEEKLDIYNIESVRKDIIISKVLDKVEGNYLAYGYKNIFLMSQSDYDNLSIPSQDIKDDSMNLTVIKSKNAPKTLVHEISSLVDSYPNAYLNPSELPVLKVAKTFVYGFITLIALISALNIVNSTYNNIMTRSKELALLKAVGIEDRKLRKVITVESLLSAVNGSIIGILMSLGLTYYQYMRTRDTFWIYEKAVYLAPIKNISIAIFVAFILIYFSSIIPYRKMMKKNIVEELK